VRKVKIAASVMCANFLHLENEIKELEKAGVNLFHFDIMDGHFVPNITFGPFLIRSLRQVTSLPFETHLMVEEPDRLIPIFVEAGSQIVTIHIESSRDPARSLNLVKSLGAEAAVAINPATPIEALEYVLDEVSMVLIMTVSPGFAGQKLMPSTIRKIERLYRLLKERNPDADIGVDGNVSFEHAPVMRQRGANLFVCGTSSIFSKKGSYAETTRLLLEAIGA